VNIQDEMLNLKWIISTLKIIESPSRNGNGCNIWAFGTLGHHALSLNAIIANRASGTFSADPTKL
jgi:uridine phosphorylase